MRPFHNWGFLHNPPKRCTRMGHIRLIGDYHFAPQSGRSLGVTTWVNLSEGGDPHRRELSGRGLPNRLCNHGQILTFRQGRRTPKPVTDLSVKMRPFAMTAAQKAL